MTARRRVVAAVAALVAAAGLAVHPLGGTPPANAVTDPISGFGSTSSAVTLKWADGITGAAGYVPAKLTPGGGRTSAPGTLTVKAYDLRNNLMGTAAMTLAVYGCPLVGVNLH